MIIRIRKLNPSAKIPQFSQKGDSGMDLFSIENIILKPGARVSCRTGIAIKIPAGFAGLIWDKGGPSHKFGIKTLGGVFDSNYTGEYLIGLVNLGQKDFHIGKGQKIAQVIFQKIENPKMKIVAKLEKTNRGAKAFGSTGIK